jgi:hypothetical protein
MKMGAERIDFFSCYGTSFESGDRQEAFHSSTENPGETIERKETRRSWMDKTRFAIFWCLDRSDVLGCNISIHHFPKRETNFGIQRQRKHWGRGEREGGSMISALISSFRGSET